MDMHRAYWNAVDQTCGLEHAAIVHDPFHVVKLAGQMLDELPPTQGFMAANPIRTDDGIRRFLALGLTPPMQDVRPPDRPRFR